MNRERTVDERIGEWLSAEAPDQLPDRVLDATFVRTRGSRQLAHRLGWRPSPMSRSTPALVAAGAAAILLFAIGVAIIPRSNPSVGIGPGATATPTPTLAASSSPTTAPAALSTGQIAVSREVDGNTDIYLVNLDGSGEVRLTTDPAEDQVGSWSPDGRTLVFTRRTSLEPELSELYQVNPDTGVETRLTATGERAAEPWFSADGSRIAYEHAAGIFVMNADGSDQHRIFTADTYYTLLGWTRGDNAVYLRNDETLDIYRLALSTGKAVREPIADERLAGRLSADGSTYAFESDREPGGVFLVTADGSNLRHLYGDWTKVRYGVGWTPDDRFVVLEQPDRWLYLVRADGSGQVVQWTEGFRAAARPAP